MYKFKHILASVLSLAVTVSFNACVQDSFVDDPIGDVLDNSCSFDFVLNATMGDFDPVALDDIQLTKAAVSTVVRLTWSAGDQISVVNLSTGKALGGSLTADRSGTTTSFSGSLAGTVHEGDQLAFIYPGQGYTEEQTFTPITVDFSEQTGTSMTGVPICVYSTATATGNTFNQISATFSFLMSYLQLSITEAETNADLQQVVVENVGNAITLNLNSGSIVATPIIGDITLTPASSYKTSANGTKAVYLSMAASPAVSGRTVTVKTTNMTQACDWTGTQLKQSTSYTSILGGFRKTGLPTADREVYVLQEGMEGLDLVIMGDGFTQEDVDNGTYQDIMMQAYNEFFGIEPFASLKNDFSVYYVVAVSNTRTNATNTGLNGAQDNPESDTKFKSSFIPNSTYIAGDNDKVREYARLAFDRNADARMVNASIVVMVNQACHAGTCHFNYYPGSSLDFGQSSAVSYCALGDSPDDRVAIIRHEINGHGFGKLADEYYYQDNTSVDYSKLENFHRIGLYRNVDRFVDNDIFDQLKGTYPLTTRDNVYWSDLFNTANNYETTESLGVFKGGYTYSFGYCRPTEDENSSIMNTDGPFNAISRRQIYYRYLRLSGQITTNQYGTAEELARFLEWDATITPKIKVSTSNRLKGTSIEKRGYLPLHPPVGTAIE